MSNLTWEEFKVSLIGCAKKAATIGITKKEIEGAIKTMIRGK